MLVHISHETYDQIHMHVSDTIGAPAVQTTCKNSLHDLVPTKIFMLLPFHNILGSNVNTITGIL